MAANSRSRHLGHVVFESMKSRPSEDIFQIDAWTGQSETVGSMLSRSLKLARGMRKLGLEPGDVMALAGKNHNNLRVPFFAAMMNGVAIMGIEPTFKYEEIKPYMETATPKIAFVDTEARERYTQVIRDLQLDTKVYVFHDGAEKTMNSLMEGEADTIDDFKPVDLYPENIFAWLVSTSGTTGTPKLAAFKHSDVVRSVDDFMSQGLVTDKSGAAPKDNPILRSVLRQQKLGLNFAPVEWISSYYNALMMPLINLAILQTSKANDIDHYIDIINTHRPSTVAINPSSLRSILANKDKMCDMTCFDSLTIAGEKVFPDMLVELQKRVRPDTLLQHAYGMTEVLGPVFLAQSSKGHPLDSCGPVWQNQKIKIVHIETGEEVTENLKSGELLVKGNVFTEYYNNPIETAQAFHDGWYKTGDLMKKDSDNMYHFVERIKMVIKYRNYQVLPLQLENVIISHDGVKDVAVTSIPHQPDGEHPVAIVVKHKNAVVDPEELKDMVARNLSENAALRGGVVFVDELPMTVTGKTARCKLRHIAATSTRL